MEKFYNVINNNFILTGIKKCCQKNCPGYETTTLCKIGKWNYVIFLDRDYNLI